MNKELQTKLKQEIKKHYPWGLVVRMDLKLGNRIIVVYENPPTCSVVNANVLWDTSGGEYQYLQPFFLYNLLFDSELENADPETWSIDLTGETL